MSAKFGDRLKELREKKRLTQQELANTFNVHKTAVSNWERSERFPDEDMLNRIANYFDVSFDYLLGKASNKQGLIVEAMVKNDKVEIEVDRHVFPNGLTFEEVVEKLNAIRKLEEMGFKFAPDKKE